MWQKVKGKYHSLMNASGLPDGRFVQTLCQNQVQVRKKNQVPYPLDHKCGICSGVSVIVYTSVEEARKYSLPHEARLVVLYRAAEITRSKTLKLAIERRIRKVAGVEESRGSGQERKE